jgi:hypothetical protein
MSLLGQKCLKKHMDIAYSLFLGRVRWRARGLNIHHTLRGVSALRPAAQPHAWPLLTSISLMITETLMPLHHAKPLPLALSFALVLAGCAAPPPQSAVPLQLQPDAAEKQMLRAGARGVQIYECKAGANGALAWAFVAPQAELLDAAGKVIGDHGAGPYWALPDGSKIVGTVKQRTDAPAAGAIPWLLLTTKSTGGAGQLASVTSVQRINTVGGVAPKDGCAAPADAGKQARVPYTADYVYFAAK